MTIASHWPLRSAASSLSPPAGTASSCKPCDSFGRQFLNDEFHQRIIESAVANEADFFSCQLFAAVETGSAHDELLIDSAGQKDQIRFTFNVGSERRRRGQVAELDLP